jgi:hypothetical protein
MERLRRMFRKRQHPRLSTTHEAMAVLGEASPSDLAVALSNYGQGRRRTALDDALVVLERWVQRLPPDRGDPELTFRELIVLLHQALQAGRPSQRPNTPRQPTEPAESHESTTTRPDTEERG